MLTPKANCQFCKRLVGFRENNIKKFPNYHNGAVSSFGSPDSQILVIGLAPGLGGANATGRPFTGDYAGDVLYPTLKNNGFAKGNYEYHKNDGFELINTKITNSVRCVPPQNKVTAEEVKNCSKFLISELDEMKNLKVILSLGKTAHDATLKILGYKLSEYKFGHNAVHKLANHDYILVNSYHTSRYNVNTGRLTFEMFDDVIKNIKGLI